MLEFLSAYPLECYVRDIVAIMAHLPRRVCGKSMLDDRMGKRFTVFLCFAQYLFRKRLIFGMSAGRDGSFYGDRTD